MKFDYKPKTTQMGSPIYRRSIHVFLSLAAFVCLVLAFSIGKSTTQDISQIQSETVITDKLEPIATDITPQPKIEKTETKDTAIALTKTDILPQVDESAKLKPIQEPEFIVKIRSKDTLAKIFNRFGVSTKDIQTILTANPAASKKFAALQAGRTLKLRVNKEHQIAGLTLDTAPGHTIVVSRQPKGFKVEQKIQPLEKQLAFGKGQIRHSLISSAKRAGLNNKLVSQMVEIFGWNIDFSLDLQPTDTFRVLYETKCLDGELIETGNILAAEFVNGKKKYQAIRYTDKSGNSGYFSPEGYGMNQAFLRSPVNYTRISSGFGLRRHPCLHRLRQHKGVDYSAPQGTPVQATSHGKIIYIGPRGGYGNVVEIKHGARYSTLYGHLSRFGKDRNGKRLKIGSEVTQGQIIGNVGDTGLTTGPHLHYEFRIDGIHHDPLTVALPKKPIPDTHKRHFIAHSKEMLRLLDLHDQKINMASNHFSIYE